MARHCRLNISLLLAAVVAETRWAVAAVRVDSELEVLHLLKIHTQLSLALAGVGRQTEVQLLRLGLTHH